MKIERYNIDGEIIKHAVICANCNNVVDISAIQDINVNGIVYGHDGWKCDGILNPLIMLRYISTCCNTPNYNYESYYEL